MNINIFLINKWKNKCKNSIYLNFSKLGFFHWWKPTCTCFMGFFNIIKNCYDEVFSVVQYTSNRKKYADKFIDDLWTPVRLWTVSSSSLHPMSSMTSSSTSSSSQHHYKNWLSSGRLRVKQPLAINASPSQVYKYVLKYDIFYVFGLGQIYIWFDLILQDQVQEYKIRTLYTPGMARFYLYYVIWQN